MDGRYIASVDQGTASSRCFVFDDRARIVSMAQQEHRQHFPKPGWVEHDPQEIWRNVLLVVRVALDKADLSATDLCALGIANQRETTVLWDRRTGAPVRNAINWQDTRTARLCRDLAAELGQDLFREKTGLPVSTYFSGPKIRWLLDQHAGLVGQTCFEPGEAKCTFGTGSFFVLNTGARPVTSGSGLLTTLAYKLGSDAPAYALEGSIAVTGALVQWFRDNLGLIGSAPEIETLALTV